MMNLPESILGICIYGSQVYKNTHENSDTDYLIISTQKDIPINFLPNNSNYQIQTPDAFQSDLTNHEIRALEIYFSNWEFGNNYFKFSLDKTKLRHSISEKASHSFVKAKKKIMQNDILLGQKSLYHSLRILLFGIQLSKFNKIVDYQEANKYWTSILEESNWDILKQKFQPIFNELKSNFKQICPEK